MIKILRESVYNRMLLACFLIIMLCNLFSLLSLYDWISTRMNSLITLISIPFAIAVAVYPKFKARDNKNSYKFDHKNSYFVGLIGCDKIEENKSMLLERKQHKNNIIKKIEEIFALNYQAKGLVLTGDSGAGKSILLRFLAKDLKEMGYAVFVNDKYNNLNEFPTPDKSQKNIFIFDQFERSLDFNSIERWIDKCNGNFGNCVFLFSFPQKFLTGIYNKIYRQNCDFYLQSYVLYLNEEDEDDYLQKISNITGLEDITVFDMWNSKSFVENRNCTDERTTALAYLLERELYNVKKGISPLIEMEFLGSIIEQSVGGETVITDGNFINCYFDDWVGKFDRKETAYAILTLFTRFEAYSLEDIKLITFEDSRKFDSKTDGEILCLMYNSTFLTPKSGGKEDIAQSNDCLFAPQHEYVTKAIQNYLAAKEIPAGVKCYTEHYRVNSKFRNYKDIIKHRYKNYTKKHISLNVSLVLMLFALLGINVFAIFSETKSVDLIWHRLFITAVSFPSIFYIYNYCDKIMRAKGRIGTFFTGLVGFSTIVASYILPDWWGIFLGIEITVFSFFVFVSLALQTVKEARANLIRDSIIFAFIGFTIVALGVIFLLFFSPLEEMSWRYNLLKYSYYVLFVIYCVMSDFNHIKYSYICSKIGYLNMFDV